MMNKVLHEARGFGSYLDRLRGNLIQSPCLIWKDHNRLRIHRLCIYPIVCAGLSLSSVANIQSEPHVTPYLHIHSRGGVIIAPTALLFDHEMHPQYFLYRVLYLCSTTAVSNVGNLRDNFISFFYRRVKCIRAII